jgi:hypothetical protein
LKNRISNLLVFDKKDKYTNQEKKFNFLISSAKILDQIEATNELIDGKIYTHSKQRAQPLRRNLRTEGMSRNIRGETIHLAYSISFLDNWNNKGKHSTIIIDIDNSSSNEINWIYWQICLM